MLVLITYLVEVDRFASIGLFLDLCSVLGVYLKEGYIKNCYRKLRVIHSIRINIRCLEVDIRVDSLYL